MGGGKFLVSLRGIFHTEPMEKTRSRSEVWKWGYGAKKLETSVWWPDSLVWERSHLGQLRLRSSTAKLKVPKSRLGEWGRVCGYTRKGLVVCRTGMLLSTSNWIAFKVVLEAKASLRGLKIVERLCWNKANEKNRVRILSAAGENFEDFKCNIVRILYVLGSKSG